MDNGHIFQTERLSVRRWINADQPEILALYSDKSVIRWIGDGQALTNVLADKWMSVTQVNYGERGYGMFAIDDRKTAETVGFGGIVHPGGQPEPELKYAFQPSVWGQGIATEFVHGMVEYCWTAHKMQHITATVATENTASSRVLIKSGFEQVRIRAESDGSQTEVYVRPAQYLR